MINEQATRTKRQRRDERLLEELMFQRVDGEREEKILAKKKQRLKTALDENEHRMLEIDHELTVLEPLNAEQLLNPSNRLGESLMFAPAPKKDIIAKNLLLNLVVKDGKVSSISLKIPIRRNAKWGRMP